ncbi:MAG TPA: alpha-ketoglutarate-dependent dioxygenase AlkB [Sphingomonadaceae bacterium]
MNVQGELFRAAPALVPGLRLVKEAIPHELEAELATRIDAAPLKPFQFGQWQGKRLTTNYGSAYDYQRARVAEAPPLPEWLLDLRASLAPQLGRAPKDFIQGLLIRYDPGAGIGWHRDRPQYGEVIGLSLSNPATLRLRRRTAEGFERCNLELAPRSLYLLSGEVRAEWEHSISPMDVTRRSITFRTLR